VKYTELITQMEKLIPLINKLQEIFYRTKVPFSVEMP
jgi:hypothetical protein